MFIVVKPDLVIDQVEVMDQWVSTLISGSLIDHV